MVQASYEKNCKSTGWNWLKILWLGIQENGQENKSSWVSYLLLQNLKTISE